MNDRTVEEAGPEEREPSRESGAPIVGIGCSAGGLDALLRMMPLVPPDCGLAFVVVQNLDPQAKSALPELLGRACRLPVRPIRHGAAAEANVVYVIPPGATLTIRRRVLQLSRTQPPHRVRATVDGFLTALAEDLGELAAGVILSGAGSDGTIGLRAIKEHGGLTLAQAGAEYDGMMRSAVATGLVDHVLPLDAIPAKLIEYFRHLAVMREKQGPDGERSESADALLQIHALLRARTGHDFREYKDRTVVRRIQRRMQVLQIEEVDAFIGRLRREPRELDLLFQDLLIGVTSFFRDPAAFDALERDVIPRLFDGKEPDDTVRVWVPGCATGEEAYSIAILLREFASKMPSPPRLQVFASDIDEHALQTARAGRYPEAIAKDVPAARLERHFVREDGTYRIVGDIREMVLFSQHSLLRDPPFSRLDLLSCRNLMIYLTPELQSRVIPLFHYALRSRGFLLLGSSENVTRHGRLFTMVDKANRIYQRRTPLERRLPEFPLSATDTARLRPGQPARPAGTDFNVRAVAERRLLEHYAPAHVVITQDGEVLHASARTGKFLELPAGAPDSSIFSLARRGLRLELRAALHRAATSGEAVTQSNLRIGTNGGQQAIDLHVQPLRQDGAPEGLYLVVFRELGPVRQTAEDAAAESADGVENINLRQLEAELRATRDRLQATSEELESSNEELKSSNEELSSMNEELQSANEELETSREELQSINEELQTVNAELNARVEELSRANSDMINLLESTQIATLFLDRGMSVKNFTPAAKDLFRLVESDTGRPISHVRARFEPESIQQDAERVLRTLTTIEREVRGSDADATYIMRMLPYRTVDNVISGVVLTFTDVTRISAAERRIDELAHDLRNQVESLQTLLDLVPVGIFILESRDAELVRVNRRGAQMAGEPEEQRGLGPLVERLRLSIDGADVPIEQHPLQRAARSGEKMRGIEAQMLRADGSTLDVMFSVTPLFRESGEPRGAIAAVVDISDRKAAELHQQALLHELQHRVKNILVSVNALAARMLRRNEPPEVFAEAFLDRLRAMGRMHDLLAQHNWQGTELRELVLAALAPFGAAARFSLAVEGPFVLVGPEPSAVLGMIFHELATNAVKYGALGAPDGSVAVHWRIEGSDLNQRVALEWTESGGPPVTPPQREGFGIGFVRRSVQYEVEGTFDVAFPADGLRVTMTMPLHRIAGGNIERTIRR